MLPNEVQSTIDILHLLVSLELSMANFYAVASDKFKDKAGFWRGIETDERQHAEIAAKIAKLVKQSPGKYERGRNISSEDLKTLISRVIEITDKMCQGAVTRKNAYAFARDFESAILEDQYYRIVDRPDPRFNQAIQQVTDQTRQHRDKIIDAARLERP